MWRAKKNWVCDFFQVMRLTLKNCSNSRYFSLDMPTKVIINAIKTICVYIKNRPWHKFVRKNSKMFWETAVIEIFRKCSLPATDVHKLLRKCFIFLPSIMAFKFSKSTWGEQLVEDIPNFTCIFVYLCMYLFLSRLLAKRKTIQTWYLAHILALTSSKTCFLFGQETWPN